MKKFIFISLLLIVVLPVSYSQFTRIGGGLGLSSGFPFHNMQFDQNKSGMIALSFNSVYEIKPPFHLAPSLTIFYPHITQLLATKTTVSTFMLDINGHYVFSGLEKFETYGIAGLNLLFASKKEATGSTVFKESDSPIGLNLGLGTHYKVADRFDFFAEVKYIFSKYDQFMANAGVLVNIKWAKDSGKSGM